MEICNCRILQDEMVDAYLLPTGLMICDDKCKVAVIPVRLAMTAFKDSDHEARVEEYRSRRAKEWIGVCPGIVAYFWSVTNVFG